MQYAVLNVGVERECQPIYDLRSFLPWGPVIP
jgi:hypothetical protein